MPPTVMTPPDAPALLVESCPAAVLGPLAGAPANTQWPGVAVEPQGSRAAGAPAGPIAPVRRLGALRLGRSAVRRLGGLRLALGGRHDLPAGRLVEEPGRERTGFRRRRKPDRRRAGREHRPRRSVAHQYGASLL